MASGCVTVSEEAASDSAGIAPADFRRALGHFCSGIVVVAGHGDDGPVGFSCQSFFSLSLDPPLVAFSPSKGSTSYPGIRKSGAFCINILAEDQQDLCSRFARSGTDKWRDTQWHSGVTGSPLIEGVIATIDCRIVAEHETGDHYLVIGEVQDLRVLGGRPLLFFDGGFHRLR